MAHYKTYRVEYTFRQPRHEDLIFITKDHVLSDSPAHAVRDGLADGLILQHLIKHSVKLVNWEVREVC